MALKPTLYKLNGVYIPQSETEPSDAPIEPQCVERPIFVLSSGGTIDLNLTPTESVGESTDHKPIICLDREIYVPASGCSDCDELEERVRALERCCADVQEILANIPTYSAGTNIQISNEGVISASVPSDVSAFYNDAGYLTLATLPIYDGGVI